jgi:hypothetical protein
MDNFLHGIIVEIDMEANRVVKLELIPNYERCTSMSAYIYIWKENEVGKKWTYVRCLPKPSLPL